MIAIGDLKGCHQREGKVGKESSHGRVAHGAEITFTGTNQATLAKGVHLRAFNVDPEAAWIDKGISLDIADCKVNVGIEVGVDGELTCA